MTQLHRPCVEWKWLPCHYPRLLHSHVACPCDVYVNAWRDEWSLSCIVCKLELPMAHSLFPCHLCIMQVVSVIVHSSDMVVVDVSKHTCLPAQLLPYWPKEPSPLLATSTPAMSAKHRLFWEATVHPLGLATFILGRRKDFPACPSAVLSTVDVFVTTAGKYRCPAVYPCRSSGSDPVAASNPTGDAATSAASAPAAASIANDWQEITFSPASGLMTAVTVGCGRATCSSVAGASLLFRFSRAAFVCPSCC